MEEEEHMIGTDDYHILTLFTQTQVLTICTIQFYRVCECVCECVASSRVVG